MAIDPRHPIAPVRSVYLFPRDGDPAHEAMLRAAAFLNERGLKVAMPVEAVERLGARVPKGVAGREPDTIRDDLDMAVALGGDGTILRLAHYAGDAEVPLMGVNLGHLGFLAAYGAAELETALQDAIEGRTVWSPRVRMRVSVRRGEEVWSQVGCNDAYVKHGEQPRMLELATAVGDRHIASYRADGLIVSTPMGSTAYNLSAGGPIVDEGTDAFTITPICPHSLTHRPVVTAADRTVTIEYKGPDNAGQATLSVDGLWGRALDVGDSVQIARSRLPLRLVPPKASVFRVLSAKLGWEGVEAGEAEGEG